MKVRFGFGLGTTTQVVERGQFDELVDALEELRFDSLWLSERITGPAPDPLIALAIAAGRTTRLKLGTAVLVIPGRNPVVLAKEMATLDRLSGGRFLPAVGLGAPVPSEHRAFGVHKSERAAWFDEAVELIRRLWAEDSVDHLGDRFEVQDLTVGPRPAQDPVDVWLGGRAPSELRRVGRLGDGWLASFATVGDVAAGIEVINATAAEHDREVDPEHFGVMVPYLDGPISDAVRAVFERVRPGVTAEELVVSDTESLRLRIGDYVEAGASKFVLTPLFEPDRWLPLLSELHDATADLVT